MAKIQGDLKEDPFLSYTLRISYWQVWTFFGKTWVQYGSMFLLMNDVFFFWGGGMSFTGRQRFFDEWEVEKEQGLSQRSLLEQR